MTRGLSIEVSGSVKATGALSLGIKTALWPAWASVALRAEQRAREARKGSLAQEPPDTQLELEEAMVAVTAAAFALDGLYAAVKEAMVIPPEITQAWRDNRAPRWVRIFETLKLGFDVGKISQMWLSEFRWLFALRDKVVHHREHLSDPHEVADLHPLGLATSIERASYTVEAAARSVDLLQSVLVHCSANPKPATAPWVDQQRKTIERFLSVARLKPLSDK